MANNVNVNNAATTVITIKTPGPQGPKGDPGSGEGAISTGSLLVTASISSSIITFTKGNSDTFDIIIPISENTSSISSSYAVSSSYATYAAASNGSSTASLALRAQRVDILNTSGDTELGLLFRAGDSNPGLVYADSQVATPSWNPSTNVMVVPYLSASNDLYVSGTLSIPGFSDVSASLANISFSETSSNAISSSYALTSSYISFDSTIDDIEIRNITASNNISASNTVYGKTGSFSYLQGNSPITIADQVTFLGSADFGSNNVLIKNLILEGTTFNSASLANSNQKLTFNQLDNTLSISNGNTVDLSYLASGSGTLSGSSIWSTGSNYYYVNSNLQVTGSFSVNGIGSFSVLSGSLDWGYLENVPSNIISSSTQITNLGFISESANLSTLNTFTGSIQTEVDTLTASTSSYLTSLPTGTISSSAQITITEAQISDLSHTDISSLNTFTSSIQTEVDTLTSSTSSYLTSLPDGVVSGSTQITDVITDEYISASAASSGFSTGGGGSTDISSLNTFTGSIQTEVDTLTTATSSYLTGPIATSSITDFNTEVSRSAAEAGFGTSGGVVGDNLGNHTASLNLDMGGNNITNVGTVDSVNILGLKVDVLSIENDVNTLNLKSLVSSSAQILPITTASITNFPTEVSRSAASFGFGTGGGGTGDIEGVTAGLGISGGGSSGTVTVTLDTGSTHFTTGVSASAAAAGFGSSGGSGTITEIDVTNAFGLDVFNATGPVVDLRLDLTEVISFDGNNKLLTSDADGTLTAESWTINANDLTTSGDILSIGNITSTGTISANSFSGDGSGLTGTSGNPYPYTGSATVSGSFDITGSLNVQAFNIDGNITASGNFEIGGNLIANGSITASSISVTELNVAGGGIPSIVSDTNIILSASNAVSIQSPVLRLKPTTTGSIAAAQNGDIMYDTNDHKFYGYANGVWVAFH